MLAKSLNEDLFITLFAMFFSLAVGFGIGYSYADKEHKIVSIPQTQAETKEGIKQVSDAAGVAIDDQQAGEIASSIKTAKKEYTVETTIKDLPKTAEAEREKAKADFSVLTDPNNPNTAFDLTKHESDTPINLNQYNIRAYKKHIRGISYYPSSLSDWKPAMLSVDYSVKISDSGKYIGVTAAHNFDNNKTYAGIRYEF